MRANIQEQRMTKHHISAVAGVGSLLRDITMIEAAVRNA